MLYIFLCCLEHTPLFLNASFLESDHSNNYTGYGSDEFETELLLVHGSNIYTTHFIFSLLSIDLFSYPTSSFTFQSYNSLSNLL